MLLSTEERGTFSVKGIRKGYFYCQNSVQKGKGFSFIMSHENK